MGIGVDVLFLGIKFCQKRDEKRFLITEQLIRINKGDKTAYFKVISQRCFPVHTNQSLHIG